MRLIKGPRMPEDLADQDGVSPAARAKAAAFTTLRGTVLRYDRPTEPVGVEDWEALNFDTPMADGLASRP